MKYWIIGLLMLSAIGLGTLYFSRGSGNAQQVCDAAAGPSTPEELGVEQFMRGVDRYKEVVCVTGVVNTASAADHMLTLLDRREFEECGVTTCASLYLPVH